MLESLACCGECERSVIKRKQNSRVRSGQKRTMQEDSGREESYVSRGLCSVASLDPPELLLR